MKRFFGLAAVIFGVAASGAGAEEPLSFEVATVKISAPNGPFAVDTDPSMVRYSKISLKNLISIAYKTSSRLVVGGPGWLDSELYEVAARVPPETSKDRVPLMLQTLLAERFKLAVHRETKEQRVYFLVAGKNGPTLRVASQNSNQDGEHFRGIAPVSYFAGAITGRTATVETLAGALALAVSNEVVDHTQLAGTFDFDLKWTPENSNGTDPDIFTAVQEQLGLKLEPGKAPVEMLVVDHAERIPTDN